VYLDIELDYDFAAPAGLRRDRGRGGLRRHRRRL
jgi:hypothetical protein